MGNPFDPNAAAIGRRVKAPPKDPMAIARANVTQQYMGGGRKQPAGAQLAGGGNLGRDVLDGPVRPLPPQGNPFAAPVNEPAWTPQPGRTYMDGPPMPGPAPGSTHVFYPGGGGAPPGNLQGLPSGPVRFDGPPVGGPPQSLPPQGNPLAEPFGGPSQSPVYGPGEMSDEEKRRIFGMLNPPSIPGGPYGGINPGGRYSVPKSPGQPYNPYQPPRRPPSFDPNDPNNPRGGGRQGW